MSEKQTRIQIEGPLPMGVAGALIKVIGQVWPNSTLSTNSRYAIDALIPDVEPQDLDQQFVDLIRGEADGATGDFLGIRDGWVAFAPPDELALFLGNVAHAIFKSHEPQAINHVEWTVLTGKEPGDPSYVLSISKSKQQTPLAMRKAAEAEVEALKAELAAIRENGCLNNMHTRIGTDVCSVCGSSAHDG